MRGFKKNPRRFLGERARLYKVVLKSRSNPGKIGVLVGMKQTDVDFYCSKKGERIKMFKRWKVSKNRRKICP